MTDPQDVVKGYLEAIAAFPAELRRLLAGHSDEALHHRPAEGEWSAAEVLGHMIDVDTLMVARVGQMIARDNPALAPSNGDEAVRANDYQRKHVPYLLNTFAERRAALVEEWRYLRAPGLARTGVHPTRGQLTVAELIGVTAAHGPLHAAQITAALEAHKQSNR